MALNAPKIVTDLLLILQIYNQHLKSVPSEEYRHLTVTEVFAIIKIQSSD